MTPLTLEELRDMDSTELAEVYIGLRDRKADIEELKKQITQAMDLVEVRMLEVLDEAGAESIATPCGTFFKKTVTKYGVDDWSAFWAFASAQPEGEFVTKLPRKSSVDEYVEQYGVLPPGLTASTEVTINVRRK